MTEPASKITLTDQQWNQCDALTSLEQKVAFVFRTVEFPQMPEAWEMSFADAQKLAKNENVSDAERAVTDHRVKNLKNALPKQDDPELSAYLEWRIERWATASNHPDRLIGDGPSEDALNTFINEYKQPGNNSWTTYLQSKPVSRDSEDSLPPPPLPQSPEREQTPEPPPPLDETEEVQSGHEEKQGEAASSVRNNLITAEQKAEIEELLGKSATPRSRAGSLSLPKSSKQRPRAMSLGKREPVDTSPPRSAVKQSNTKLIIGSLALGALLISGAALAYRYRGQVNQLNQKVRRRG